jgi:rhodanese-related sulfurtransferase
MQPRKLLFILLISALLAGYSSWLQGMNRPEAIQPGSGKSIPATDIPLIEVTEAEALWRHRSTVFIDVRPAPDFAYGHIAGAVSLPLEEFDQRLPEVEGRLRRAQALVVYCKSVDCGKSLWAAIRLRQAGLTQTKIFPAGWYEWSERKLPSHRTSER